MKEYYTESNKQNTPELGPKKETLDFLLQFSKAFTVVKYNTISFDTVLN